MLKIFVDWILTSPHFEGTGGRLLPLFPLHRPSRIEETSSSRRAQEYQAVVTITHLNNKTEAVEPKSISHLSLSFSWS
jgi:hypothetical protein